MKRQLVSICLVIFMILCTKSVFAQDNETIKAEIKQHREAIRQLEQQLRSSQGSDYEGTEEGEYYGESGENLPDNAGVDKPWEGKADLNKDGVVGKTEKQQWDNRRANRERGNSPGSKGGPGKGRGFKGNSPGSKGGPGARRGNLRRARRALGRGSNNQSKGRGFKGNPPGPKGGPGVRRGNLRRASRAKGSLGRGPKNQKGGARSRGRKGRR